ncbi:hypothetical protein LIER_31002 [Lithospermum erythrorhizon]|uniref:Retrovirus-related Pol polyprotein from transposon TNT 1-94 n=1 Tax=Lithospermum erythrorhizon TaxID=34254 RepID=A0AAV3RQ73_LITER
MNEDKTHTKIPFFDGHYDHWSELMENLLRANGLFGMIERGFVPHLEGTLLSDNQQALLDDARLKDHQVKNYLFQALDRSTFEQILDRSSAKVVWESLKKQYGGNEKVKKSLRNALRRDFEVLEMKRGETIESYFGRVMMVANKLRSNGEAITNSKINEKILRTLTDQFTYVVVSIEEARDIEVMTVDDLRSTLMMMNKNSIGMEKKKMTRFQRLKKGIMTEEKDVAHIDRPSTRQQWSAINATI